MTLDDSLFGENSVRQLYEATQALLASTSDTALRVLRNEVSDEIGSFMPGSFTRDRIGIVERIAAKGAMVKELYEACMSNGPLRDAIEKDPSFLERNQVLHVHIIRTREYFREKMTKILSEMSDGGSSFAEVKSDVLDCVADIGEYNARALHVLKILHDYCYWVLPVEELQ